MILIQSSDERIFIFKILQPYIITIIKSNNSAIILCPPFQVFYTDRSGRVSSNPLLDQLPSYQSLLYRRKSSTAGTKRRSSSRGRIGSSGSGKWGVGTISRREEKPKSQTEERPIRELPRTMAEKRRDKWEKYHYTLSWMTLFWKCLHSYFTGYV